MKNHLERFNKTIQKMNALTYADSVLHWDATTGNTPASGSEARSRAMGSISGIQHSLLINPDMEKDLEILLENKDKLSETDKLQAEHAKIKYDKIAKIPVEKYEEYNSLVGQSQLVWEEAKKKSDFSVFEPNLEKIISSLIEFAEFRGYSDHPYNVYIDDYEPGMTKEKLDEFFSVLRKRIVPLLKKVNDKKKIIETGFLYKNYPVDKQREVSLDILKTIGFDIESGVLAESEHPFTTAMDIKDVRLTTHFYENDFKSALLSTAHEGGHAIYEQNIDPVYTGTLLATGTSLGIHESQSRIYENNFLKSRAFLGYYLDYLKKVFPENLKNISADDFYKAMNICEPSYIRIEADELTYCLHVMIRYEIELGLIEKSIPVKSLPDIWNKKMEEYLGITPPDDSKGVLQDVHWSAGLFGYFPTYALGTAASAQIENAMKKQIDTERMLSKGDFTEITKWLNTNIHRYGSALKPSEVLLKATGEELNSSYYCDYLEKKYGEIYNL